MRYLLDGRQSGKEFQRTAKKDVSGGSGTLGSCHKENDSRNRREKPKEEDARPLVQF
jgi:hypothetical protein